jgi:hypothetical protein
MPSKAGSHPRRAEILKLEDDSLYELTAFVHELKGYTIGEKGKFRPRIGYEGAERE